MLAKTDFQPVNGHRMYRPLREQAHSHRDGVCCTIARRLHDEQIPTIHAPRKNRVKRKSPVGAIGGHDGREDGRSVTSMVLGTPQSRASSIPQGRRLLRDSAASRRRANSYNSRPAQNRVKRESPVGAIGGYDGREDGRSVTSMVLGTPQSRASALLHIARQPALSSSHGRRC